MPNSKEYPLIPMPEIRDEVREIAVAWAEDNKYHWIGDKHKLASDIQNYADAYSSHLQAQVKELSGIIDSQKQTFDALVKKYRELETMLAEAESNYEPYQNECLLLQAKVSVQDKRIAELEEALRCSKFGFLAIIDHEAVSFNSKTLIEATITTIDNALNK